MRPMEQQTDSSGNVFIHDRLFILILIFSTEICAGTPDGHPNRAIGAGDSGGPLQVLEHGR